MVMVQGVGGSGLEQGARHPTVQIEMHEFGVGVERTRPSTPHASHIRKGYGPSNRGLCLGRGITHPVPSTPGPIHTNAIKGRTS